jgi:hypothetical protein
LLFFSNYTNWSYLALNNSKWNYKEILDYEAREREKIPLDILIEINKDTDQQLDPEARVWLYIKTNIIWGVGQKADRVLTQNTLDPLIMPTDLSEATPYNCFFLRFFDFSPVFPFREISTTATLHEYKAVSQCSSGFAHPSLPSIENQEIHYNVETYRTHCSGKIPSLRSIWEAFGFLKQKGNGWISGQLGPRAAKSRFPCI